MYNLVGPANTAKKKIGLPGEGFIEVRSLITIVIGYGFFDGFPDGCDNQSTGDVSGPMAALGDPKRRAIVERLRRSPAPVGKIAETLPVPRPAVSQHLKVLTGADLVTVDPFGARRIYILRPEAIADLRA